MRISRLERDDAVFTDASANTVNPPNFYSNTDSLTTLDWEAIDSRKWKFSEEERHRKMAEALIFDRVDITEIDAIVVYNNWVADGVRRIFARNGVQPPSIVLDGELAEGRYRFYYTKYFISGRNHETLVTGPYFLQQDYRGLLAQIDRGRGTVCRYRHANMAALLGSIAANFNYLPELQGINGLSTSNFIHNSTVGQHTLAVVANIQRTDIYTTAGTNDRNTLLLAAYLHDIGKGPASKWNGRVLTTYADHPHDAMPGLFRILTEEIGQIDNDTIRRLCMLVVYHDIVGDCLFKGRDRQQIVDIIEDEKDIDMLVAIGLADVQSLNSTWYTQMLYCWRGFKEDIKNRKGI